MKRIAINGLGRIGRLLLRRYLEGGFEQFSIVAVNDPMPVDNLVYLMKYDSTYRRAPFGVQDKDGELWLDDFSLQLFSETDPGQLPWEDLEIDLVIDSSGRFTKRADATKHIDAGARRVLLSAPAPDADITLVLGVNENHYDPERHFVISNASCTTNSLAPPLKVLNDKYGIEAALATTVHAYTASQSMVDTASRKKNRGRAGAINIIPSATGADAATVLVLPQLKGRLNALALRVPVPDGAITDISAQLRSEATPEEINATFKAAALGPMSGIIEYSDEELVSSDIIGNAHSAIIHGLSTRVLRNKLVKVQAWYDNEYAYACRCLDLVERLAI